MNSFFNVIIAKVDFPGNIMIIDDQFELVYQPEPERADLKIQYTTLKEVKTFCEQEGIPLVPIVDTTDVDALLNRIKAYSNVRLLIMDLDLNNDGEVGAEDDVLIIEQILRAAVERFGFFYLLISSAHAEKWNDICENLAAEADTSGVVKNMSILHDKTKSHIGDLITKKISSNFSLNLIFTFETALNRGRDAAFRNLLDFEKSTWEGLHQMFSAESGEIGHMDLTGILIARLRQYLVNVKYSSSASEKAPPSETVIREVFSSLYYIRNQASQLEDQPVWTGNLYLNEEASEANRFLMVITPECDIAQGKHLKFKVVYGFEINIATLPEGYNPSECLKGTMEVPLYAQRFGKTMEGKWPSVSQLQKINKNPNQYLYILPYVSPDNKQVILDFRDSGTINNFDGGNYTLIARVLDPMMTDILDKYAYLFNRKGLLPILNLPA